MSSMQFTTYSSATAITASDTTLVTCKAIYVGGAGNVTVNMSPTGGTSVLFTAPPVGSILPINLAGGRVMSTGTTASALVALN
jgi:hypothetical protein